jgi:chromosome partitioning protein
MSMQEHTKNLSLLGVAEIAEMLGVTKQTVSNWRSRDEGFPLPTADLKSGPVWIQDEITSWAHANGHRVSAPQTGAPTAHRKKAVVCAVINAKGGVGKSTVALNLGWTTFLRFHKRVLLIDIDPQFNLSQYLLGGDAYEKLILDGSPTVSSVFASALPPPSAGKHSGADAVYRVKNGRNGSYLDLIPSDLQLAWIVRDGYGKTDLLDNYITHRVGKDKYDLILIDCPPTDSTLTDAAYSASDWLLIPVRPEFLPAIGLPLIDLSLRKFLGMKPSSKVQVAGIVLNGVIDSKAEYRRSKTDILKAAKEFGWPVFKNEISASESYPKGSRLGLPIIMTNHARWEKITEFSAFTNEFVQRISL